MYAVERDSTEGPGLDIPGDEGRFECRVERLQPFNTSDGVRRAQTECKRLARRIEMISGVVEQREPATVAFQEVQDEALGLGDAAVDERLPQRHRPRAAGHIHAATAHADAAAEGRDDAGPRAFEQLLQEGPVRRQVRARWWIEAEQAEVQ